ncbi:EAL domain-containing protein [Citrobacter sp. Cs237]|uniref:EAL domain-containing protein n=1 Tax=Citrobacter TaxID=544 RepID=UPI002297B435|nr:EAL domain-containing protein [Citrobacter sp. Cs237]MDM2750101.1 EAL domain-containing protein [Citrobacter sp. Cs237]HBU8852628.1 EAL domain-containing protein [Citrobacter sedlakii]HCT5821138.1 EAL domain-containing protein [Citrobacter sedlakii]
MLTGYKFESIRVLQSENVIAWEVLSTAPDEVDLEHFFSHLSLQDRFSLFFAQLTHVLQTTQTGKYYLNASEDVLLSEGFIERLAAEVRQPEKIAIELTDLERLRALSPDESRRLRERIATLRQMGIAVWADDVHDDILTCLLEQAYAFSGAKIDKHAFWAGREQQTPLLKLAQRCRQIAEEVLIEGIETVNDYELACRSTAHYGQGYLWNKPAL